jgi:hypothetical protein
MRGTNSGPLRFAEAWSQRDELAMLRQLGHFTIGAAS